MVCAPANVADGAALWVDWPALEADLAALIACDTTFPPGENYPAICDALADMCAPFAASTERIEVPAELWAAPGASGPRTNLLVETALGPADAKVTVYGHTDTAPIGEGWTRPPLQLTAEGDRLYGRGTADTKGAIAATIAAMRLLAREETPLAFRPVLAFCTDEEGGLYPGARHLAEIGRLNEPVLNLNGGATPRIYAGSFGSMDVRITCVGRAAHSGVPAAGINALEGALPVAQALSALGRTVNARASKMPAPPNAEGPLRPHLSLTAMHAGDKGSAIPGLCHLTVNRRYMPEEEADAVLDEIRAAVDGALQGAALTDWRLEVVGHLPPVSAPDGPLTDRWTAAQAAGFGVPLSAYARFGSTTSSDFGWAQKAGVQHIMLGGLMRPERNVHGPDEHTTQADLIALTRAIALFFSADGPPQYTPSPKQYS